MKSLIIILFSAISIYSYAQETSKEFGKFLQSEIEMRSYDKDVDTDAIVLFDIGKSKFIESEEGGYNIEFTRTKRIKILKDDFDENLIIVEIPYYLDGYNRTERIKSIQAYTVHIENGFAKPKKVLNSSIYDEKINNNWRVKKFVFPDVRKGDILEFEYVFITPFLFNLPDWEFQNKIPTVYSEYEVRMIPFYEYSFLVQGISNFDYQNSVVDNQKRTWGTIAKSYGQTVSGGLEFQDYIHTYALKDVPAFKDESYITSVNDYIIKIDFQLSKIHNPQGGTQEIISTWPALIDDMIKHESFGKYIKSSKKFAKKTIENELHLADLSDLDKAETIINYVKNSYSWNGFYDKYVSKNAKDFASQKEGNSAEINLYLVSLLKEAGIAAEPVILSTRNHGKVKYDYPYKHFFNYVLVLVDNKFLADGTESKLPFNELPSRCFNDKGLIISNNGVNFIELKSSSTSSESISITIDDIKYESSNADVKVNIQSNAYLALNLKNKFSDDREVLGEYYSTNGIDLKVLNTLNYSDYKKPYVLALQGKANLESIGENIIIKPFLNFPFQKNTLTQKERSYPVDFIYPFSENLESIINIPESYSINTLPNNLSISNDLAEITLTYEKLEGAVKVSGKYQFKKAIYKTNEYNRIKHYIGQIVKKFNAELVLEKN